jgi:hypothetical protein
MNKKPQSKGGNARAKSLTPAKRRAIAKKAAKARWSDENETTTPKKHFAEPARRMGKTMNARDEIATAVLAGLWSNVETSQKFAAAFFPTMSLPEAFTRIAYEQADEVLRLRGV